MENFIVQIAIGIFLILISFMQGMIIKQANDREKRFDEKIADLLSTRESAFENMEASIAKICELDRAEHEALWERVNYHSHTEDGRVVIGEMRGGK